MVSISVKVLNIVNLALGRAKFTGLLSHVDGYITECFISLYEIKFWENNINFILFRYLFAVFY